MKKTQKKPLIVSLLIILIFALGGCSSLLGPTRPIYSYPTETASEPASEPQPEPTPPAPQQKPTPPPEPPKPATPPEEFVFQADADGVAYVNLIDWPFSIILTDPLIILFDAEETGTFEIIHDDFARFPLYMSIYSFDQDDALADNLINGNPAESLQVSLEAGNTYILGIGVLSPKDLNKTTRFSIDYLGASVEPEPEYIWVETPHPHTYDIPVDEVEKIELELEEAEQPKVYPIAKDITIVDGAQAVDMAPFKDNPANVSKSELNGNIEGVLTAADSPYTVVGDISVAAGKNLVIEEGVILRFKSDRKFQVYGTLDVRGNAGKEVVFTADNSTKPGSWVGLIFQDGSKATLNHARVLYAGGKIVMEGSWRSSAMYTLGNAAPTIAQSQIAYSEGDTIQLFHNSSPSITKSDLNNNTFIAQIFSPSAGFSNLQYNRYSELKNPAIKLAYKNVDEVDTVLKAFDNIPYSSGGLKINSSATMTLTEGIVLKFDAGSGIDVSGRLKSAGAAGKPVILTSGNDDIGGDTNGDGSASKGEAGQWKGIYSYDNGTVDLQRTALQYTGTRYVIEGGWREAALIANDSSTITVANSEISTSSGDGLLLFNGAGATVTGTLFDGVRWPIQLFGPKALPTTISGNDYAKVTNHGIRLGFKDINSVEFTLTSYDRLPYYSEGLSIRKDADITLAEGVVLKFGGGSGIDVAGSMKAAGSIGKPVIITSANDDIGGDTNGDNNASKGEAGQWKGIYNYDNGTVDLQQTALRYTGTRYVIEGGWREAAIIGDDTSSITVAKSEISSSSGDGLLLFNDAGATVTGTLFDGVRWPIQLFGPKALPTTISGNDYAKVTNHGIRLSFRNIDDVGFTLRSYDRLPYYSEGLSIRQDASITLAEGVVLKFGGGSGIDVAGSMKAAGSTGKPVIITSANDDIGGDTNGDGSASKGEAAQWKGIYSYDNGTVDLQRTALQYTGTRYVIEGGWREAAIIGDDTSSITVTDSEITGSVDGAQAFKDARIVINNSALEGLRGKGVENSGSRTIDARQLWWGSSSGPTTENNPSGTGFAIVGDVVYSPYLKNRPSL